MIELIADYIESTWFDAEVNVVSSLDAVIRVIEDHAICRLLALELRRPCNVQWLGSHIKQLVNEDIDPKYQHPKDTALMVYTYFLCKDHPEYVPVLDVTLGNTPNLEYSIRLIMRLARERETS